MELASVKKWPNSPDEEDNLEIAPFQLVLLEQSVVPEGRYYLSLSIGWRWPISTAIRRVTSILSFLLPRVSGM